MRDVSHPPLQQVDLCTVLHALSDPGRLAIVRALAEHGEYACGAFEVPVSKGTLSHHFRVLREAGLTRTRITGRQRFVSVRWDDLEQRFPGLVDCLLAQLSAPAGVTVHPTAAAREVAEARRQRRPLR